MSLSFKRSRLDTAVNRTFPNAKEIVIARSDVSNRTLLKNPYNNKSDPHDIAGLRPLRQTTDNRGNVFAVSTIEKIEGITNLSLLQNPNRIQEDPTDTPRTLSLQVIKDINSGKLPKYIREDRGVNQIAYMILQFMKDNGVKMATIAMLKSFITGHKLSVLLDKGGQFVTRAFSFFRQLMDASSKLYKKGILDISLDDLVTKYTTGLVSVYGPIILNEVSHAEISNALKELGALSGVLSRLFRDQNAIEPNKLVPYEQLVGLPPNPTPVVDPNSGDNEPSPPQNIEEPDNIKQEGKEEEKKEGWIPESEDPASLPARIAALRQKLGMPVPESLRSQPIPESLRAQPIQIPTRQHDGLGLMRDANTVGNFVSNSIKATDIGLSSKIDQGLWGIVDIGKKGVSKLYGAAQRRGTVPVANQPAAGPPLQSINRAPRLVADVQPLQPVIPPGVRIETEQERFNRNIVELASRKAYRDIIAGTYTDFGNEDLDSDELIRQREYAEFEALNAELIKRATLGKSPTQAGPAPVSPTQAGPAPVKLVQVSPTTDPISMPTKLLTSTRKMTISAWLNTQLPYKGGLTFKKFQEYVSTVYKLDLPEDSIRDIWDARKSNGSKASTVYLYLETELDNIYRAYGGEGRKKTKQIMMSKKTKIPKNIDAQILALLKG